MKDIGVRIKLLRKSENLTQKQFAQKLLITQSYLSGLENNNEVPSEKLIKLICLEFGIAEEWLRFEQGDMYDDVYENSPEHLTKQSNKMLLNIMNLINTDSNVEYGHYTYSLLAVSDMLSLANEFNINNKVEYLNLVEMFFANMERMIQAALIGNDKIEKHLSCVNESLAELIKFINGV